MEIIYTGESVPEKYSKSLFLAGPSPRDNNTEGWRKEAIKLLEDLNYDGVLFNPEYRDGDKPDNLDYDSQIDWEDKCLSMADIILFWVPRNLETMPAFTTNVEFGFHANSGRIVFGAPPEAPKNNYLKYYAEKFNVPMSETLEDTLSSALEMMGEGVEREGGECYVPLFIWRLPSFQSWYLAQKRAGNTLNHAQLLYTFRPGFKKFVFLWILKVNVHIASENRDKENEFVLARPDISSVCLYHRGKRMVSHMETEIVLVKEFRSPANTKDGFIRELAGGSSIKEGEDPEETAAEEVFEETGFHLTPDRLQSHGALQLAGTLSSHKAHLYSAELTEEEIQWFKAQDGVVHGKEEDTERTFVEVKTLEEIISEQLVDWTSLGMLMAVFKDALC